MTWEYPQNENLNLNYFDEVHYDFDEEPVKNIR